MILKKPYFVLVDVTFDNVKNLSVKRVIMFIKLQNWQLQLASNSDLHDIIKCFGSAMKGCRLVSSSINCCFNQEDLASYEEIGSSFVV